MIRNACTSLNVAKRHLFSGTRLVSTAPADRSSHSRPVPPPPAGDASKPRKAAPKKPRKPTRPTDDQERRPRRPERAQDGEEQPPKRLLQPHEVSVRLHKMMEKGRAEEAVEYVQNLPLDALNVVVWNTLITLLGNERKYRLAHEVYVDMKRRGFKPSKSTYTAMLNVFSKVDSWTERGKLLQSAHKVYSQYVDYLATVREANPKSPELSNVPVNLYLIILARAGDYPRIFDVYNSLDEDGPFSPNHFTYTAMFKAIYKFGTAKDGDSELAQKNRERAASDARFVWRQMTKRIEEGADIQVDGMVISSVVQALALGRPADHIVAFDIVRDYVGLAKPGEDAPPARVTLSPPLLQDILWLCNRAQKYRLCVHFVQQLMDRQPEVLDRGHFDHVLTAYGSLSALGSLTDASRALQALEWMLEHELTAKDTVTRLRLRPGLPTFTLALVVCWRAKDWDSALRTFELMTGLRADAFADGAPPGRPQPAARSGGRNLRPDAAAMSCLVRTALETGDLATMRQCARIVAHLGAAAFLGPPPAGEDGRPGARAGARFAQDRAFYTHKAARAVQELVDVLVPKKTEGGPRLSAEEREWVGVRSEARTFLIEQREHRPKGTPQMEETPLGSAAGLAAMDSVVQWDLVQREQKSSR